MMAFTIIWVSIFILYFPLTKELSLEEITALFGDEVALEASHIEITSSIVSEKEKTKV
jgi:hypothetical protein